MCVITYVYVCHDACVAWLIHMCDMTHAWLICMRDRTRARHDSWVKWHRRRYFTCDIMYVCHDLCAPWRITCVTWLIRDMNYSYVWHDLCVAWLNCSCDMTCVWHDSLPLPPLQCSTENLGAKVGKCRGLCVCVCVYTYVCVCACVCVPYTWHNSFICETWLIRMWDMTHSYMGYGSCICETWLIHMCMSHP